MRTCVTLTWIIISVMPGRGGVSDGKLPDSTGRVNSGEIGCRVLVHTLNIAG